MPTVHELRGDGELFWRGAEVPENRQARGGVVGGGGWRKRAGVGGREGGRDDDVASGVGGGRVTARPSCARGLALAFVANPAYGYVENEVVALGEDRVALGHATKRRGEGGKVTSRYVAQWESLRSDDRMDG